MSKICGVQSPTSCLPCRRVNKISHDTRSWFELPKCIEIYYNAPVYKPTDNKLDDNERNSDTDTDSTCFPKSTWNTVQHFCNVSLTI
jgi:hypothetical protein